MKFIIVTGSNGFIARNFIKKLSPSKNIKYIFTYHDNRPDDLNLKKFDYKILKLDLTKKTDFNKLPKNDIKFFFHFAASPNTFVKERFYSYQFKINTLMTINIAEFCSRNSVEYLFFSSSVYVYSGTPGIKFKEDDKIYPTEILGASKFSSELILKSWASSLSTKILILRFFTVYGDNANKNQIIPKIINKISKSKKEITFFKNEISRDFIHISDTVKIIFLIKNNLKRFEGNFNIFNIGNGKGILLQYIIKYLINLLNPNLEVNLINQNDFLKGDTSHCADITKIKELGYKQTITIEDGLKSIIKGLKK